MGRLLPLFLGGDLVEPASVPFSLLELGMRYSGTDAIRFKRALYEGRDRLLPQHAPPGDAQRLAAKQLDFRSPASVLSTLGARACQPATWASSPRTRLPVASYMALRARRRRPLTFPHRSRRA